MSDSDIPADVMERAKVLYVLLPAAYEIKSANAAMSVALFAQALLSERQRALEEAAKIAIVTSARFGDVLGIGTQVASAIRSAS